MNKVVPVSIVLFIKDLGNSSFSIWMQQRIETGPLNGLWEFPGGKIHQGESANLAARREVLEEVGVLPPKLFDFKTYSYSYEGKNIILHVFLSPFTEISPDKGRWENIDFKDKSGYLKGKIPPINHLVIDEVADYLKVESNFWDILWRP